jgi:hypothetical protein
VESRAALWSRQLDVSLPAMRTSKRVALVSTSDDIGERVGKEMAAICAELPTRLNIVEILRDAYNRLSRAAEPDVLPPQFFADKVAEVLREIATHAVEEFTRRTGQPFLWVDEPEMKEPDEPLMSFGLDEKGNVTF